MLNIEHRISNYEVLSTLNSQRKCCSFYEGPSYFDIQYSILDIRYSFFLAWQAELVSQKNKRIYT